MEWGIELVDKEYRNADIEVGGDLGEIRNSMNATSFIEYTRKIYDLEEGNLIETKKGVAKFTPTRYEAYLQIYKLPDKAIDTYSAYCKLRDKQQRSPDEEKEFQKLKRIDDLADAYVDSHRYMLEKGSYRQQDVDYTFALEKMENNVLEK